MFYICIWNTFIPEVNLSIGYLKLRAWKNWTSSEFVMLVPKMCLAHKVPGIDKGHGPEYLHFLINTLWRKWSEWYCEKHYHKRLQTCDKDRRSRTLAESPGQSCKRVRNILSWLSNCPQFPFLLPGTPPHIQQGSLLWQLGQNWWNYGWTSDLS